MATRCAARREAGYPPALLDLRSPPLRCHWCGPLWLPPRDAVAVVGARTASPYGIEVAEEMGYELARLGICVVSGLARGIDAAAHTGALAAGGPAVAVVACDPGRPPLRETAELHARLVASGAVCAEFGAEVAPRPALFLRRNRIVAALARVVVVVEAGATSGALTTAAWARKLERRVAAVPGDVTRSVARGPLQLLRRGAEAVGSAADVQRLLETRAEGRPESGEAERGHFRDELLEILRLAGTAHPDRLAGELGWDLSTLLARLAEWELAGRVERAAGGRYRLRREERAE